LDVQESGIGAVSFRGATIHQAVPRSIVDVMAAPGAWRVWTGSAASYGSYDHRERLARRRRRWLFWDPVGEYLERLDNGAATTRIVYLADQLGIDLPIRAALVASFTSGYSLLDPTRPRTGSTDSTYRLRVNVEPDTLAPTES